MSASRAAILRRRAQLFAELAQLERAEELEEDDDEDEGESAVVPFTRW